MKTACNRQKLHISVGLGLILGACGARGVPGESQDDHRPNILFVVADDLGYSDLGAFGGEINTPTIDALAEGGLRLTNFHATPECSPTRAMLMSGVDNHIAGIGVPGPSEEMQRHPGYEGYLNFRVVALPELLRDAGYHTYMTGKWHLGLDHDTSPAARGFESSFALLSGSADHFMIRSTNRRNPISPYHENDAKLESLPDDFYSTKFYADKLIEYIDANIEDGKPFFGWLAYTAPHWPLQAPEDFIDRYAGKYDEGYDVLRDQRIGRMKAMGLLPDDVDLSSIVPVDPAWHELDAETQKMSSRKMEIYAAMVENLDYHFGRVVQYLKDVDEFENTFIVFLSDNGADGSNRDERRVTNFVRDNSYENLGRPDSWTSYGAGWAHAASAAYKFRKGYVSEGGIRVPAIVYHESVADKGETNDQFLTILDIVPTFLSLADTTHPGDTYHDRSVMPLQGKSFLPLIKGDSEPTHPSNEAQGWEVEGDRAMIKGPWKLLWLAAEHGAAEWELYNLENDPAELTNLAGERPEVLEDMLQSWREYVEHNGVVIQESL